MKKVQIGFIGCGSHASANLYPVLKFARCELVAVCDLNRELAERNARTFGHQTSVYTSVDDLISHPGLQAVMVVGPDTLHYEAGLKALTRGLHLFTEKPPAPDLARTRELVEMARIQKQVYKAGFMKRHGMTYSQARKMIRDGTFIPATGVFAYSHWRMCDVRSMLLAMSSHIIDLALSFFGIPSAVTSRCYHPSEGIALSSILEFPDGRHVQLVLDSYRPRIQERVELSGRCADGSSGLIVMENVQHMEFHTSRSSGIDLVQFDPYKVPEFHEIEPGLQLDDIRLWRPDYGIPNMGQSRHFFQGFVGEVREFCDAILEQRPVYPDPAETLAVMNVIEAICRQPNGTIRLE